jgi:glucose-6-phosphate 1-dehydrogenase
MPSTPNSEVSDTELLRWIVRSFDRLKDMIDIDESKKDEAVQRTAFLRWHDQIIEEAQRRDLLPHVEVTVRTDLGKKIGAI